MFKDILKRIFPRGLLKKGYTVYNTLKIYSLDKVLFPEYYVDQKQFFLYRKGYPFRENKVDISTITDDVVRSYMQKWYDWTQEEFILRLSTPCYIEPEQGWAIIPPNRLLYYSLGISRTLFLAKPSILKFWRRKKVITIPYAISLRDTGEENYFHFFNDVLAKIVFLQQNSFDITTVPIVVSKKLWGKPYFQYYIAHNELIKSLQWLVQKDEYIHCTNAIFCKPLTHRRDLLTRLFEPLYKVANGMPHAVFLTRNKNRMRHIVNAAEIESVFRSRGFKIIDADNLSVEEQIHEFTHARVIAGIHGAGLTNLMLRNSSCHILEIFPFPQEGYLPFHYIMLANLKGFSYDAIIGKRNRTSYSTGFFVDPLLVEKSLRSILKNLSNEMNKYTS